MTQARIMPWQVEAARDDIFNCWALAPGRAGHLNAMVLEPKDADSSDMAMVEQVLVRERPLLLAPVAIGKGLVLSFAPSVENASQPIYWQPQDKACLVVTAESRIEVVTSGEVKRVCAVFKATVFEEESP